MVFIAAGAHRATAATATTVLNSRDVASGGEGGVSPLGGGERNGQPLVIDSSAGHVRRCGTVMPTRLSIDALALVAAVVDALSSAAFPQLVVNERSPPLARLLHPLTTMKRSALRRSTAVSVGGVRAAKPLLARTRDS